MAESQFLELVEHAAGIPREEAREAVRATLCTLAERITHGEAQDIAVFVPGEFRDLLPMPATAPRRSALRSSFAGSPTAKA
jgi:uncharacterized protein (DUF2267 family)